MPIISFEKILKILEIICKVLLSAIGAVGIYNASSDSDEQSE